MRRRMRLGRRNMRTLCRRNSISHLRCTHNFEHLLAMRGLEEPAGRKLGRMERAGGVCVCGSEMGGHVSNQSFESGVHHALGACTVCCTFHHLRKKQKFRNVFGTSRTRILPSWLCLRLPRNSHRHSPLQGFSWYYIIIYICFFSSVYISACVCA